MSLKSTYQATRGDERKFLRDIQPGDHLYVINNHSDRGDTYSEWIVTNKRSIMGHREVESPSHGGVMSAQSLLRKEREVLTQRPTHLPNLGVRDLHGAYTEDAQRAARLVGDLHAIETANALSAQHAGRR
ncbi:hypothetical protein [Streptomyces filamentosus]|uniref:hypothetical protein n=1 Tax=Streptomyces filamentosus TaxID=67294 RepID=UPI00123A1F2B|nr:hypothetical protein [Streptomyces filamentosus]KAA6216409.1 hypothetical protein CP979_05215 [Streptomyces filamentosus]